MFYMLQNQSCSLKVFFLNVWNLSIICVAYTPDAKFARAFCTCTTKSYASFFVSFLSMQLLLNSNVFLPEILNCASCVSIWTPKAKKHVFFLTALIYELTLLWSWCSTGALRQNQILPPGPPGFPNVPYGCKYGRQG